MGITYFISDSLDPKICESELKNFETISAGAACFHWVGRVKKVNGAVHVEWPGVYMECQCSGGALGMVVRGKSTWDLEINGKFVNHFSVPPHSESQGMHLLLADELPKSKNTIRLTKTSENPDNTVVVESFLRGAKAQFSAPLLLPGMQNPLQIECIGDSFTAGYGNSNSLFAFRNCTAEELPFECTNARLSFGSLLARQCKAQYQLIAISGKGLIHNYDGNPACPALPHYYPNTLITQKEHWDYSSAGWHPDYVIIGIGINDFQGENPLQQDSEFCKQYQMLLQTLRNRYTKSKYILCATLVQGSKILQNAVQKIHAAQCAQGYTDTFYFEYCTQNTGLNGHPSIEEHQALSCELYQFISNI
jgi:lysophospholipase L1-like esterase